MKKEKVTKDTAETQDDVILDRDQETQQDAVMKYLDAEIPTDQVLETLKKIYQK